MGDDVQREAFLNGWFSHKNGVPSEENPYNERTQAYSHGRWLSGWCDRFNAIKYGYELVHDDEMWT